MVTGTVRGHFRYLCPRGVDISILFNDGGGNKGLLIDGEFKYNVLKLTVGEIGEVL